MPFHCLQRLIKFAENTIFIFCALKNIREVVYNFDSNIMQAELLTKRYSFIVLV